MVETEEDNKARAEANNKLWVPPEERKGLLRSIHQGIGGHLQEYKLMGHCKRSAGGRGWPRMIETC